MLTYTGSQDFRYRVVLATLSGKELRISGIRSDDAEPGVRDHEVSFLRLIEAVTNGSRIDISYTGTTVVFRPGIIVGGSHSHKCPLSRGIGYYIEPLLLLAPFAKKPMVITLYGLTNSPHDISTDLVRTSLFPLMEKFGIDREELRILKRGSPPQGGGEVVLSCPHLVLQPATLHATYTPQITKIRGVAYSTRVSPDSVNRMIESAKSTLKPAKVETFIYSDVTRGEESGKSPGFGISLVAETKEGFTVAAECVGAAGVTPEDVGVKAACNLLEELSIGGSISKSQLKMALVLMAIGKEDVGRIVIGKKAMDASLVRHLRYLKDFFNVQVFFKEEGDDIACSVKGQGFVSASKKIA